MLSYARLIVEGAIHKVFPACNRKMVKFWSNFASCPQRGGTCVTSVSTVLVFPPFRFEAATGALWRGQQRRQLRPQAAAVLRYLSKHAGQIVSKEELLAALWPGMQVSRGVLKTYVWELRQALGDQQQQPRFIETLPRRGYRWIASLTTDSQPLQSSRFKVQGSKFEPVPSLQPPNFVGREAELRFLHDRLEKARRGERQFVFITGEPGIGKTALVETFLQQITDQPHLWIAQGQCIEHYGVGEAYLPLLAALGRLGQQPGKQQLRACLQRYAPTWLVQLPSLLSVNKREQVRQSAQGATRERMLRELAEAMEGLATKRELVLVLEDLHWSDASTLDWLSFVARRPEQAHFFILGTYRPEEVQKNGHPLSAVMRELSLHGLCAELPLKLLTERNVAEYLKTQFSAEACGHASREALTEAIYQRTEGNPLFIVTLVNDLRTQEELAHPDGHWDLQKAVAWLRKQVPPSLQQLIERQMERLKNEEQRVLEVASVAGLDFSAAAVAAALKTEVPQVEELCAALARRHLLLKPEGNPTDPERRLAERYRFRHVLYQNVAYGRVTLARRRFLHQRIGEWKEAAYGERAREIAAELAAHFEQGRDYQRAVHYLRQAGENAQHRSAHTEATSLLTKALQLLRLLPDTPEHLQQEVRLHLALGSSLAALKGYAAVEVEYSLTRARELCQRRQDSRDLIAVLLGLCEMHYSRAEFHTARALAEQVLRLVHHGDEDGRLPGVYATLSRILFAMGEFSLVQEYASQGIGVYDARRHGPYASPVAHDPGVNCLSSQARALWHLGYPDQAVQCGYQALALARELSHPVSLALALNSAVALHHWRGEWPAAQELGEKLLTLAQQQAFPHWAGWGMLMRGEILARQGQLDEGIAQMRQGFAVLNSTGAKMGLTGLACELAWAYEQAGRAQEGLPLVTQALAVVHKTREYFAAAELYRLKGQLTLPQPCNVHSLKSNVPGAQAEAEAEVCFHKAIEIACQQQAKSLELRATTSLARLWVRQGKREPAYRRLAELYGWFTEGFDTVDLQEARALLEELS